MLLAELGVDAGHVGDRQGVGDITREGEESVFSLSVFVQVGLVDGRRTVGIRSGRQWWSQGRYSPLGLHPTRNEGDRARDTGVTRIMPLMGDTRLECSVGVGCSSSSSLMALREEVELMHEKGVRNIHNV